MTVYDIIEMLKKLFPNDEISYEWIEKEIVKDINNKNDVELYTLHWSRIVKVKEEEWFIN